MSQNESGQTGLRVDESLSKIHDELNKFSDRHELKFVNESDISIYLNQTEGLLSKMSADDAGNAAYMVSRHAAYVKKQYNREQAIVRWAEDILKNLAVTKAQQYADTKYMKLEDKIATVVAENEYAREINKKLLAAKMKSSELYDMHAQLNRISDTFIEIQRTRRSDRFHK